MTVQPQHNDIYQRNRLLGLDTQWNQWALESPRNSLSREVTVLRDSYRYEHPDFV